MKRRTVIASVLTLAVLAGFAPTASSVRAQSEELLDLMGLWSKSSYGCTWIYQLSVSSGNAFVFKWQRSTCRDPNTSSEPFGKEYRFTVNGRSLTGTVVYSVNGGTNRCPRGFPQRTFSTKGRISPDWKMIVIIDAYPGGDFNTCRWTGKQYEDVHQFTRHR